MCPVDKYHFTSPDKYHFTFPDKYHFILPSVDFTITNPTNFHRKSLTNLISIFVREMLITCLIIIIMGHTDKVSVWSDIIGVPVPGGSRGPESEALMVLGYQYYISTHKITCQ